MLYLPPSLFFVERIAGIPWYQTCPWQLHYLILSFWVERITGDVKHIKVVSLSTSHLEQRILFMILLLFVTNHFIPWLLLDPFFLFHFPLSYKPSIIPNRLLHDRKITHQRVGRALFDERWNAKTLWQSLIFKFVTCDLLHFLSFANFFCLWLFGHGTQRRNLKVRW